MSRTSTKAATSGTFSYFAQFAYAPSFDEVLAFLPVKESPRGLQRRLDKLVSERIVVREYDEKGGNTPETRWSYTLRGHRIFLQKKPMRMAQTKKKLESVSFFLQTLRLLPWLSLVGLSGSAAMHHCNKSDDIDLFIITKKNRLWTGRFFAVVLATVLGVKRSRGVRSAPHKVCLNLFFDEKDVRVPTYKQNTYTAHEVLQMKPLFSKHGAYARFLDANKWVYDYFPNAMPNRSIPRFSAPVGSLPSPRDTGTGLPSREKRVSSPFGIVASCIEYLLKKIQMFLILRHRTKEIITPTQLWFFPRDFEQNLHDKSLL